MTEFVAMGALAMIFLSVIVSPGPNVLIVTQFSVSESRLHGTFAALGVAAGSALWASFAIHGLTTLFLHAAWLQPVLQLGSGLYLCYVARKIWQHARQSLHAGTFEAFGARSFSLAFRYGLVTNLSNPKAIAFYTSVFTAIMNPTFASWVRWAAVVMITALAVAWYTTVAVVFSVGPVQRWYRRSKLWIDRLTALVLLFFGFMLLWELARSLKTL